MPADIERYQEQPRHLRKSQAEVEIITVVSVLTTLVAFSFCIGVYYTAHFTMATKWFTMTAIGSVWAAINGIVWCIRIWDKADRGY